VSRTVIASSVVLVLPLAAFAGVAVSDRDEERVPQPAAPESAGAPPEATPSAPERELVLVRRRDGLPASWIRRLRRSSAVDALAKASRTQWLLRRSASARAPVDAAPPGYAVPLDVHVVDPRAYARATREPAFRRVRRGRVLLSETSARLRDLVRGGRMTLADGRTVRVAGVVADRLARDAEVVAATADVPRAARRQTAVVVATTNPGAVARAVPNDPLTRVATLDAQPTGRRGIIRPAAVKRSFGEFAVRLPYGSDWIGIDPGWLRRNVVTRAVPILGTVTCNRAFIAPLRRALGRLERRGLERLVDPGDYAGCYAPRRIPSSGSLSLHAWGLAIDLNASENPQGSEPRQDRRLVRAFEREGFTWGGRWPTAPDGMHFELHGDGGR
jgi:hypothetical protein